MPSIVITIDDLILEQTLVARNPSVEEILAEGRRNRLKIKPDKVLLNKFSNIDEIPAQKDFFISRVLDQTIKEFNILQMPFAFFLVLIVTMVNTICFTAFFIYLKSVYPEKDQQELVMISLGLTATFIAPITEELHKRLTVKMKMSGSGFIAFQILETLQYLSQGATLLIRLGPIMMHAVNTFIHQYGETTKKDKKPAQFTFIVPVLIHGLWNGLATLPILQHVADNYGSIANNFDLSKAEHAVSQSIHNTTDSIYNNIRNFIDG